MKKSISSWLDRLYLPVLELDGRRAAEDGHDDLHGALVGVDFVHGAVESVEGAVDAVILAIQTGIPLARVELLDDVAWTVPTIVGKTIYVRDKQGISALDLG